MQGILGERKACVEASHSEIGNIQKSVKFNEAGAGAQEKKMRLEKWGHIKYGFICYTDDFNLEVSGNKNMHLKE